MMEPRTTYPSLHETASVNLESRPIEPDGRSVLFKSTVSEHTGLRQSSREKKPTWKILDNREQHSEALGEFWSVVKVAKHVIDRAERDFVNPNLADQQVQADINRELKECLQDLDIAYGDLRRTLLGTIPQDARRHMDLYKDYLERLIRRTEPSLSSISVAQFPDQQSVHSSAHSNVTGFSRVSSTSSKKLMLAARAASLQIELAAKEQENRRKLELKRLEDEELERQVQYEAAEKARRAKIQTEMEIRREELEKHRISTELKKTEVELQTIEQLENAENRNFCEAANPTFNVNATAFTPIVNTQLVNNPIQVSTPRTPREMNTLNDTNITSLLKTVTESVNLSRLPVPEPPVFDGDPLQYPAWKASFATLIESRHIPSAERIHYLKQYLKGEAREAVEALFYFDTEEAYTSVRAILDERYGNPFLVSEAYRNKIKSWPKVNGNDYKGLRKYSDFLRQCMTAMIHIDDLRILNDCRENRKMVQKLPNWLNRRWCRIVDPHKPYPDFKQFVDFLKRETDIVCNPVTQMKSTKSTSARTESATSKKTNQRKSVSANTFLNDASVKTKAESTMTRNPASKNTRTSSSSSTEKKNPLLCTFCEKSGHEIYKCFKFCGKTPQERKDFIFKRGLCFSCLKSGHVTKECKQKSTCEKCQGKHPSCLHGDYEALNPVDKDPSQKEPESTSLCSAHSSNKDLQCSMTVPVYVSSEDDPSKETLVYALLDTQSDTTFISDETVESLEVNAQAVRLKIHTMTSSCAVDCRKLKGLQVRSIDSDVKIALPTTYSRSYIPLNRSHIPTPDVAKKWPHLCDLADKISTLQDCEVGLLIGYNCPQALAPITVRLGQKDEPYGVETQLGWSVVGLTTGVEEDEHVSHTTITRTIPEELKIGDRNEVAFMHQTKTRETPAVTSPSQIVKILESDFQDRHRDKTMSQDDIKFLNTLRNGIRQNEDGFYQMPLPFKDQKPDLPDNLPMAKKRLEQLKKKMKADPDYKADYQKFMHKMISEGDAELVSAEDMTSASSRWIIPHHGVYHKKKGKLRVDFDCAARYSGTCLNDHLLQGPDLMNTLLGCLLRFRKGPIAVAGDIERMFYRFKVDQEDRNYLQFLWWDDDDLDSDPKLYRMTVHLFGAASSPGCANFSLKKLVADYEQDFSNDVCQFIRKNFYVDDGIFSCTTVDEAALLIRGARELCQKANIRLHKFISNNEDVMNTIPETERAGDVNSIEFAAEAVERVLGMQWNIKNDQFRFHITLDKKPMTRRGVLSTVASIYDPLGCLAPFVLIGKRILQEMCKEKCGWDDPLSENLRPRWERWIAELHKLAQIQILRCYIPEDFGEVVRAELHHFSDASTKGYGQCSYLRMINKQDQVHCSLILGKSRVTPLKGMTIPRLELTAAVVSVKIADILREELAMDVTAEYFWTDSKIVLGYVNNDERRFHVFVANRINQIKNSSDPKQWEYVRSSDNPADHASRGLYPEDLKNSNWFSGPDFLWKLKLPTEDDTHYDIHPEDPEVRKVVVNAANSEMIDDKNTILKRLDRFSSWFRVTTAIAVIQRCIHKKCGPISQDDRGNAERTILKMIQGEAFVEELKMLKDKTLQKGNRLYKLDPFVDDDGILRVGGRLQRSSLQYGIQHPVILPKTGHMVSLITQHCHKKVCHQGRGFTMNDLRSSGYWILGCSKAVSSEIFKCVLCRKLRGQTESQKMAELPKDRTEPAPPFSFCGIDCFGPFVVKEGRRELKRYGLIVTCMASRAVHIECLDDMTTDCFINALRCLIALRGPVQQIRCDNGLNFVGAKRILQESLKEVDDEKVRQFLSANQCDFLMNSPYSSHMGGAWERHIRTIRSVLTTTLEQHSSRLDTSTLRTFLYKAMAIINCRPLTAQNINDPTGPEPLTPNHLITMKTKLILPPPGEFAREDIYARQRWRRVQRLAEEFWSRWKKEYLLTLQKRGKWNKTQRNMMTGDIVLLKGEEQYRGDSRLAKVIETITDDDGLVRRVKLLIGDSNLSKSGKRQTKQSVLERPIHKIIRLV